MRWSAVAAGVFGGELDARALADSEPVVLGVLDVAKLGGGGELAVVLVGDASTGEGLLQPTRVRPGVVRTADPAALAHVYTVLAVMFGWLIFNATNLEHVAYYFEALVIPRTPPETYLHVQEYFSSDVRIALVAGIVFSMPVYPHLRRLAARAAETGVAGAGAVETLRVVGLMGLCLLCAMSLGAGTRNPFIYFRF